MHDGIGWGGQMGGSRSANVKKGYAEDPLIGFMVQCEVAATP